MEKSLRPSARHNLGPVVFALLGTLAIVAGCYFLIGHSDTKALPEERAGKEPVRNRDWAPTVGHSFVKESIVVLPAQFRRFDFELSSPASMELVVARKTGAQGGISVRVYQAEANGKGEAIASLGAANTRGGLWDAPLLPGKYTLWIGNIDPKSDPLAAEVSLIAH